MGGASNPDCEGDTLLHMAAREQSPRMVKLLVDLGADQSIRNAHGVRAIDLVMHVDIMRLAFKGSQPGSSDGRMTSAPEIADFERDFERIRRVRSCEASKPVLLTAHK